MIRDIRGIIHAALDEQSSLLTLPLDLKAGDETPIFGADGLLDSMGLVTLVVTMEDMIERDFGVAVSIVSDKAMSARRSPFATIGSLAEFVCELIQEARNG